LRHPGRYYLRHPGRCLEAVRKWQKTNVDKLREAHRRRRARKKGAGGVVSESAWMQLCNHYGNVCLRCGSSENITQDHIVPLSKGGSHTIDNLQPLCKSCNCSKHDKIVDYRPGDGRSSKAAR
jgi:5-methylcytosine-specific restriction endonuclease McrA